MISVVIPLYNKESSITSTLESVLNQTFQKFQIIVVDDGSTDNSIQKVKNFNDERIHLICKGNGGVSSARNVGICNARHEYIAFLDADDLWIPTYLEEQIKSIRDFSNASLWGTSYSYLNEGKEETAKKPLPLNFRGIIDSPWSMGHLFWTTASCCRKTALMEIGMFDERIQYGEDLDVWWRLMLTSPVAYFNKELAYYRFDTENRLMKLQIPFNKLHIYYFEKYAEYRKSNPDFRHFIDQECMWWLFPYYLNEPDNKEVKRVLKQIDLSEYKLSFRLRFWFPLLYNCYLKIKGTSVIQRMIII